MSCFIEELGIGNAKRLVSHPTSRDQWESLTLRRYAILDTDMLKQYLEKYCQKHDIDMNDIQMTWN